MPSWSDCCAIVIAGGSYACNTCGRDFVRDRSLLSTATLILCVDLTRRLSGPQCLDCYALIPKNDQRHAQMAEVAANYEKTHKKPMKQKKITYPPGQELGVPEGTALRLLKVRHCFRSRLDWFPCRGRI